MKLILFVVACTALLYAAIILLAIVTRIIRGRGWKLHVLFSTCLLAGAGAWLLLFALGVKV